MVMGKLVRPTVKSDQSEVDVDTDSAGLPRSRTVSSGSRQFFQHSLADQLQ